MALVVDIRVDAISQEAKQWLGRPAVEQMTGVWSLCSTEVPLLTLLCIAVAVLVHSEGQSHARIRDETTFWVLPLPYAAAQPPLVIRRRRRTLHRSESRWGLAKD